MDEWGGVIMEKSAKTNQSIEKTFHLIEIMAANNSLMRLQDIAKKADLPASTALRLLNTLQTLGYVNQDDASLRYSLSLKFARIGNMVSSRFNIREMAKPYLAELSYKCQEAACLGIEQDREVVYIDVENGPDNMLQIMHYIGKRAPMHCTGIGKLMLAAYDSPKLSDYISLKGLPVFTPNTLVTEEALRKELQTIRENGFALDREECELGAVCLAAPVKDYNGRIIAGISVSGPITRLTFERLEKIRPWVLETADHISGLLAYTP